MDTQIFQGFLLLTRLKNKLESYSSIIDTLLLYCFFLIYPVRVKTKEVLGEKKSSKNCMHLLLLSNSHTEDQQTKIWNKSEPAGKGGDLCSTGQVHCRLAMGFVFSFFLMLQTGYLAINIFQCDSFYDFFQIFTLFPIRLMVLNSNFILYVEL